MNAAFDARPVDNGTVCCVLKRDLTLENAAVLQCKVKDVAMGGIGHRIEPYGCGFTSRRLQTVPHASEAPVSPMQPAHALKRLRLDLHLPALDANDTPSASKSPHRLVPNAWLKSR
jgi:hypothetical protein